MAVVVPPLTVQDSAAAVLLQIAAGLEVLTAGAGGIIPAGLPVASVMVAMQVPAPKVVTPSASGTLFTVNGVVPCRS
jgi:hypothetical protein